MSHPGDGLFSELDESERLKIITGWGLDPADEGGRSAAERLFNARSPQYRWEILCALMGRDGSYAAEVECISAKRDPDTVRAFDEHRHPDDPEGLLNALRNGTWLDAQSFPPLQYHVDRLIPEGLSLMVGAPKIGKSWFVLDILLAIAAGGYALGQIPVEQRQVLYLGLEDGDRRLQDRCRTLLGDAPIPESFHYITKIVPGMVLDTIKEWLEVHGRDGNPLIVIDTLGKVMPPATLGESTYQRDYRIGSALKGLVDDRPGTALLVNHHDRKASSEDFVDAVSGTHGLAGAADTVIVLFRARHESGGLLKVTGRDVAEGEYVVEFQRGSSWRLGGTLDEAASAAIQVRATHGLDERSRAILGIVSEHPDGVRAAEVAEALDIDRPSATTYLTRLCDSGRITRLGRGLYAPIPKSVISDISDPSDDAK